MALEWLSALAGWFKGIIVGTIIEKAIRKITDGVTKIANTVASWLENNGYYTAARTVRHFARFLVYLGKALVTAHTVYGDINTVMDMEQVVDDVEIEGSRYNLVGPTYGY